jgi:hypothetical protein
VLVLRFRLRWIIQARASETGASWQRLRLFMLGSLPLEPGDVNRRDWWD